MTRRTWAAVAAVAAAGCLDDRAVGRSAVANKPVDAPALSDAAVDVAARVDRIGRELMAASPFVGVDPLFHTVAVPDPLLFHPDLNGVLVSDGLVARCRTDAEVAAVLAAEVGQMAAEKRLADRLRADADGTPDAPPAAGGNRNFGGLTSDQSELAERALLADRRKPAAADPSATDARAVAVELLRAGGYAEADLTAVAPLLKAAAANRDRAGGLAPKPAAPRWTP